jgi:glyoxalase family protein
LKRKEAENEQQVKKLVSDAQMQASYLMMTHQNARMAEKGQTVEIAERGQTMESTITPLPGIHHGTAVVSNVQRSLDFYAQVLGLRLVKKTVHFDDPGRYHLYFGNRIGDPGTLMTFCPLEAGSRRRQDRGEATISFSVPESAVGYWRNRFRKLHVPFEGPFDRFREICLAFLDPDGLRLEMVAGPEADARQPWEDGPIPADNAVRGLYSVTLATGETETTTALLTGALGFSLKERAGGRIRVETGVGGPGRRMDLLPLPESAAGPLTAGHVHHVAWRVRDGIEQQMCRRRLAEQGIRSTPPIDRRYYQSVYFREPGGILFELATDGPGFTLDETAENLGKDLQLPSWLETYRPRIEAALPELTPAGQMR